MKGDIYFQVAHLCDLECVHEALLLQLVVVVAVLHYMLLYMSRKGLF